MGEEFDEFDEFEEIDEEYADITDELDEELPIGGSQLKKQRAEAQK